MTGISPDQAARDAFISGCVKRGITAAQVLTGSASDAAGVWEETARAAIEADAETRRGEHVPVCPGCRQAYDSAAGCVRTCGCIGPAAAITPSAAATQDGRP